MDPRHTREVMEHLQKQNEMLMTTYNTLSHELHKLQVEEEMLMRKFYELMMAQGLTKKTEDSSSQMDTAQVCSSSSLLVDDSNGSGDDQSVHPTESVPPTTSKEHK